MTEVKTEVQQKKALGGWKRIGITASVLWLIVGGAWGWLSTVPAGTESAFLQYGDCGHIQKRLADDCSQELSKNLEWNGANGAVAAAFYAFPPVLIGWPLIWGIVAVVRWIRAGFRQE